MFHIGEVVAFKFYQDPKFPKATEYHRVVKVEGSGRYAQVYTEDKRQSPKHPGFFMAEDLRPLRKREREHK